MTPLRVLLLGGLDPCGGAGITADARVLQQFGALGLPIALVLTVQNRFGFRRLAAVDEDLWQDALAVALADGELHAVKTGLLADAAQVEAVARTLRPLEVPLVVDPVLSATAGGLDPGGDVAAAYRRHLLPLAAVATPNRDELAALAPDGVAALLRSGCRAVIVKGGHGDGATARDVLHTEAGERAVEHPRMPVGRVHGTGCAFAAALAAQLAAGVPMAEAMAAASRFVHRCLSAMGEGDAAAPPRPLQLPAALS